MMGRSVRRLGSLPVPWLSLAVWCALYPSRIARLGFYYGDGWITIVAFAHRHYHYYGGSLMAFVREYAAKPVGLVVHLAAVRALGDSAPLWQAALAAIILVGAWSLYGFLAGLEERARGRRICYVLAADLAVALWLAAPLDLGATVLPNMANALVGQAFFFVSGWFAMEATTNGDNAGGRRLLAANLCLLVALLSYEAYYFQCVTVMGLIAAFRFRELRWKRWFFVTGTLVLTNALCVIHNRTVGLYVSGVGSKQFDPHWRAIANTRAVWEVLTYNLPLALQPLAAPLRHAAFAFLIAALAAIAASSARERNGERLLRVVALSVLAAGAFGVMVVTYALAGYGVTFLGVESRIALAPLWLAVCLVFAFLALGRTSPWWLRWPGLACALVMLALFCRLEPLRVRPWALSWDLQQRVLEELATRGKAAGLGAHDLVVYVGPYYVEAAPVFQADGQLTCAAKEVLPDLVKVREFRPYFLSVYNDHVARWDGTRLIQSVPGGANPQAWNARDPWLWNCFTGELRPLQTGEVVDPRRAGCYMTAESAEAWLAHGDSKEGR